MFKTYNKQLNCSALFSYCYGTFMHGEAHTLRLEIWIWKQKIYLVLV